MHTHKTCAPRALLLALLASGLTACATLSPPPRPVLLPQIPPPPAELMQPPTSGSWSESAQQLYRKWLKLLTPATPV